jgi:hypothetical protein
MEIPVKNGLVGMPDLHWWKPFHNCAQFKIIKESKKSIITCSDQSISDWWAGEWRWDMNGVNLGKFVDDLEPAKGIVEGGYFIYAKRS